MIYLWTKMDGQNLVNLSYGRIETGANFAGRYTANIVVKFEGLSGRL